jgi:flagellar basal-body rod protein FlgB
MIGKLDQTLGFHEAALSLRAGRQQMLASNIANADTPNYKARDIDFGKALQGALAKNGTVAPAALVKTSAAHLSATGGADKVGPGGAPLLYRNAQQANIDGNTVDMDVERNQFTDNAIRYEASITLINGQIRSLLTAIQG